jgi:BlaI family transcriptional regulator, penicillinase repressor
MALGSYDRPSHLDVSRRERQILDVLFERGQATAAEIQAALPDAPSYSAVRALLRILEAKRYVRHDQDGPRYVYRPVIARESAGRSALRHLLRTFFDGSPEQALAALLDPSSSRLSDEELDRLAKLIERARRKES